MSTTTTANLDSAMKVIFADPLIRDIVTDSELMTLFRSDMNVQTESTTGGRYIEMAHYLRLAGAAGARAENDYIPVPQAPNAANSRIYLKKVMGVVEMTGDVMRKVRGDVGAFINYMEQALPDTKERVVNEVDRMYIGYGAGIKARVAAINTGTGVITLKDAMGVAGYEDAWLQFQEGETVVFSATPSGAVIKNAGTTQAAQITAIVENSAGNNQGAITVVGDAALLAAIAVNDYIFSGDQSGTASQNGGVDREIAGLLAGVDDGGILTTYNNISRTTTPSWKATVFNAASAPYNGILTENLLTLMDAMAGTKAATKIDVIVTNPHAPIGYWNALKANRIINDPRSYTGGKGALYIQLGDRTLPFRTARKLPPQVMFALTTSTWRRFTLGDWQWDDTPGSIWNRVTDAVGRKDAYYAVGFMYEQLACIRPRGNFRIDGLIRQFTY